MNVRRQMSFGALTLGVLLVLGAVAWTPLVLPELKRFPANLDTTLYYTGEATSYTDQKTALPLPAPLTAPITVERKVTSSADKFDPGHVAVHELVDIKGAPVITMLQDNLYVIDAKAIHNVPSLESYAYTPDSKVDRAGSYRVSFPFDVNPKGTFEIYNNETQSANAATATSTKKIDGLDAIEFTQKWGPKPIGPAFQTALAATGAPTELTIAQLDPKLRSVGIDFAKISDALLPKLSTVDGFAVAKLQGEPIKVNYSFAAEGTTWIEQRTGSIIDTPKITETIYAAADTTGIKKLLEILNRYPNVEGVPAAIAGLNKILAEPPAKAMQIVYGQTPASVAATAKLIKDNLVMLDLAESTLPWSLGIAGAVLILLGLAGIVANRRRADEAEMVSAAETPADGTGTDAAIPAVAEAAATTPSGEAAVPDDETGSVMPGNAPTASGDD